MNTVRIALGSFVMAVLFASIGCRSGMVGTVKRRDNVGETNYVADKRIGMDHKLKRTFTVDGVNSFTGANGLLMVQIKLRNRTDKLRYLEYRFEWTDQNGMKVNTPSSRWHIERVKPGDMIFLKGIAPNEQTKDFYIKLQYKEKR